MNFSLELFSVYFSTILLWASITYMKYIYCLVKYTMQFTVVVLTQWRLRIIYCRYTSRWRTEPSFFALMLSWEMMHCRVIRAVDHTQTLYLLVRTRSKDLYTADKVLVGPLVLVICYAVDRQHDDDIMTTSTKLQWFWKRDGCWW